MTKDELSKTMFPKKDAKGNISLHCIMDMESVRTRRKGIAMVFNTGVIIPDNKMSLKKFSIKYSDLGIFCGISSSAVVNKEEVKSHNRETGSMLMKSNTKITASRAGMVRYVLTYKPAKVAVYIQLSFPFT